MPRGITAVHCKDVLRSVKSRFAMHRICLASLLGLFATTGCFSPTVTPCAISCGAGDSCPDGTSCGLDGFCHSPDDESVCSVLIPDAAVVDASELDADLSDASPADATVGCGDGVIDPDNNEVCDDFNTNNTDGCSDTCQVEKGFICVNDPSECHTPPGVGQLIITEIHKDPDAVNDPLGEWFEIYNPTGETFQLLNTVFSDDGGEQQTINVPLTIAPNQNLLLGNNADTLSNGGVTLDFAYPDFLFVLANGNDEIVLIEPFGLAEIDRVEYRDATFPDTPGRSLSLSSTAYSSISNNIGANWCEGQAAFGDGDLGSPGEINPACP